MRGFEEGSSLISTIFNKKPMTIEDRESSLRNDDIMVSVAEIDQRTEKSCDRRMQRMNGIPLLCDSDPCCWEMITSMQAYKEVRLSTALSPGSGSCLETSKVRYHENGIIESFSHLSTYARVVRESCPFSSILSRILP